MSGFPPLVDHNALHVLLQRRAGAGRVLEINQRRLSEDLQLSVPTTNRVIMRMVNEGRLRPVGDSIHGRAMRYEVVDYRQWVQAR